jgi:hypothetical protein
MDHSILARLPQHIGPLNSTLAASQFLLGCRLRGLPFSVWPETRKAEEQTKTANLAVKTFYQVVLELQNQLRDRPDLGVELGQTAEAGQQYESIRVRNALTRAS